ELLAQAVLLQRSCLQGGAACALAGVRGAAASSMKMLRYDPWTVDGSSDSQSPSSDDGGSEEDEGCDQHGSLGALLIKYRPDVDGLRAVAVTGVIIYHMNEQWLPGGYTGVDVFFVISGYVVTGSLLSHQSSSVSDFLCGFYARRIKRLAPALLLVVGVTGLILALTEPPSLPHVDDYFVAAACAVCGVANLFFGFLSQQGDGGYWDQMTGKDRTAANPYVHTWSLGVEEQFYLVFPLLLMLTHGRPGAASGLDPRLVSPAPATALAACAALSLCVCWWMTERVPDLAFYALPARFWELAAGAIIAELEASRRSCWPVAWRCKAALAAQLMALLLLGSSFWFVTPEAMGFPFPGAVLPVAAAICFIVAGESDESFLNHKVLGGTVAVYIGKLSYPLYLWHWPVLTFASEFSLADPASPAGCLVLASITFALSALTYHAVEAGFRAWRPSRTLRPIASSPRCSPPRWPSRPASCSSAGPRCGPRSSRPRWPGAPPRRPAAPRRAASPRPRALRCPARAARAPGTRVLPRPASGGQWRQAGPACLPRLELVRGSRGVLGTVRVLRRLALPRRGRLPCAARRPPEEVFPSEEEEQEEELVKSSS
ncbi:unnamed protein product, partial [Prorocentrum cordatum]